MGSCQGSDTFITNNLVAEERKPFFAPTNSSHIMSALSAQSALVKKEKAAAGQLG